MGNFTCPFFYSVIIVIENLELKKNLKIVYRDVDIAENDLDWYTAMIYKFFNNKNYIKGLKRNFKSIILYKIWNINSNNRNSNS